MIILGPDIYITQKKVCNPKYVENTYLEFHTLHICQILKGTQTSDTVTLKICLVASICHYAVTYNKHILYGALFAIYVCYSLFSSSGA